MSPRMRSFATEQDATQFFVEKIVQAFSTLSRGDHYIMVMINEAVGRHLKPWWQFR